MNVARLTFAPMVVALCLLWSASALAAPVSGVVYNARTGEPIFGVRLQLFYDDNDLSEPGLLVPADRLPPREQNQLSKDDGSYAFEMPSDRLYRIGITSNADNASFPSTIVPPITGFPRSGEIGTSATPSATGNRPFYMRFDATNDNAQFLNNHIALDLIGDRVSLDFQANRKTASTGDILSFSATLTNNSGRNLREAEGKGLYFSVALARGLTMNLSSLRASVRSATGLAIPQEASAARVSRSGDRLLRFGPFNVSSGSILELSYQATVGIDTKPGRYDSRMIAVTVAGISLSPEAVAQVAIVPDRDFSTSTILGRVFCDDDGDGAQGSNEAGVFGAKVYAAMGSIATTDEAGRFHLTRVPPGSHVFKLDEGSLAGGKVLGEATRLLVLSEGLPMQLRYPVNCARTWVDSSVARVVLPLAPPEDVPTADELPAAPTMALRGRIRPMTLSIDGQRRDLPGIELQADFPQSLVVEAATGKTGPRLLAVPVGGFASNVPRWSVVWNRSNLGAPKSWRFTIEKRSEDGSLGPVLHRSGKGAPPPVIEWNGLSDGGVKAPSAIYVARLTLTSETGVEVATMRRAFGIGGGGGTSSATRTVVQGTLFAKKAGKRVATKEVTDAIAKAAAGVGNAGRIEIEVHGDGAGDRLKSAVQTQSEAKFIREQFVAAGIDVDRVEARGRGASEPVNEGKGSEARKQNRRLVLLVHQPNTAQVSVPLWIAGKQELRIAGRLTPIDAEGGFETVVPRPSNGLLAVDMLAASGRRVALPIHVGKGPDVDVDGGAERDYAVVGDLAKRALQIDFTKAPDDLWLVDANLTAVGALPVPELQTEMQGTEKRLSSPMDFRLLVSSSLSVKRWELVVARQSGAIVHRVSKDGQVPAVLRWDGLDESGTFVLTSGQTYRYWLDVETNDASGFSTAPRWFAIDPAKSARVLDKGGRLFSKSGSPRANIKNLLSRFVARDAKKTSDRFSIVLEVVGDAPRVDAVRSDFVAYLQKLGLKPGRYDLVARELVGKRDHLSIVRDSRPRTTTVPEVRINRRRVALDGSTFKENVKLAPGVPLVVEVQSARGALLRIVSGQSGVGQTDTAGGELIAPGPSALPPKPRELRDDEVLASDTPARSLRVHLPPRGQVLGDTQLAISGSVDGGSKVRINGKRVAVGERGAFHVIVPLAIGKTVLVIRADDALGGSSTIRWPVRVAKHHTLAVGMVEGIAATSLTSRGWFADTAGLAGMSADTTLQVGPLLLSARAQGFVKSRMSGGRFSDTVEVTAHINTARERDASAFFEQVIDPVRSDLTLGDNATEFQDVNTRGKLYAKVVAGDSSAAVGSVRTRLEGGGELFSYDRTADGAVAQVQRDIGNNQVAVRAFSTSDAIPSVRDINWFRATGGSLYYLRHGHVLEGSEKVQIIVRDRDSGLLLSASDLSRGVDYSVEYEGGRVRLTEPLTAANRSSWVIDNMDSSSTPMGGNLVYLSVQYEHEDNVASAQQSRGAYASTTLEERLSIGAGIVSEDRGDQDGYRLLGADASLHLGEHSHVSAEIAASRQRDAGHFLSTDGGLSFGALQRDSAFEAGGRGDSLSGMRLGWKLSADLALRDWTKAEEFRESSLSLYVQDLDRGFASGGAVFDEGRFKFGGRLRHRISESDMLLVRHEGQVSQQSRVGPTLEDVMANATPGTPDERASYITSAQWARDVGLWHYKFEAMHQRITSTAALANDAPSIDVRRLGLGTLAAYDLSARIRLHVGQQVVADQGDGDPVLAPVSPMGSGSRSTEALAGLVSNVGGEFKLAPDLSVGADLYQRWNGDNALRVGLRNALSSRGSMYVQEQVGEVDGRLSNTTIVGAEDTFGDDNGGRTYGEYQLNRGVLGNRNRSVLGLGRRWNITETLGLGAGFEHQQAFGGYLPDGTSIGDAQRNVGHTSITYAPSRRFRIAAQAELRLDNGDSGSGVDAGVLGADPREGQLPGGFADHDGIAQGAALIIAPGKQTQLLTGIGAEWHLADKHTWLGRARTSFSTHTAVGAEDSRTLARFSELTTGWAFRPITDDKLEILSRYSYLREQRPSLIEADVRSERSHVVALLPYARLPHRILLSGKLAYKWTSMNEAFVDSENLETRLSTILAIARLGYQFYGKWDASGEARVLGLWGTADAESKLGSLLEIGHSVGRHLRIAAGYNFSHFSDNELGDLQRDSHGVFFRMTGMY